MTQPPTGGVLVMQVHTRWTGAYIGGWIADCENPFKGTDLVVPLQGTPGGSPIGLTKMVIRRDALQTLEMFGTLILTHFLLTLGGKVATSH